MFSAGAAFQPVPRSSELTVVSLVRPDWSCQRTRTFRTPQLPLVRRAKKRMVGRLRSTHTVGETAVPPASIASDLESLAPRTDQDSLPAVSLVTVRRPP